MIWFEHTSSHWKKGGRYKQKKIKMTSGKNKKKDNGDSILKLQYRPECALYESTYIRQWSSAYTYII